MLKIVLVYVSNASIKKPEHETGADTGFFSWGVQTWIFYQGGPKLNFRACQRKKEGITLHFENFSCSSRLLIPYMVFVLSDCV